jgi:hypothetical protein
VSVLCCQVEVSATAGHSSRGFIPNVVCVSVIAKPRQWGGPGPTGGCCASGKIFLKVILLSKPLTQNSTPQNQIFSVTVLRKFNLQYGSKTQRPCSIKRSYRECWTK